MAVTNRQHTGHVIGRNLDLDEGRGFAGVKKAAGVVHVASVKAARASAKRQDLAMPTRSTPASVWLACMPVSP